MKYLKPFLIIFLFVAVLSFNACGRRYAKPTRCICYDEPKFVVYKESVVFNNVSNDKGKDESEKNSEMSAKLISALNSEKSDEQEGRVKEKLNRAITDALNRDEREFKINLENLYEQNLFKSNSSKISAKDYNGLDVVVNFLKKTPDNIKVRIEGHTDSTGRKAYNQTLSEKRAQAVAKYFIDKGIDPKRITTKGWGSSKPIATNSTEEGKAKNRRTEMIFIFQDIQSTQK